MLRPLAALFALSLAGCVPLTGEPPDPRNPAVRADVRVVGSLERTGEDAIAITRLYLAAMRQEIASPQIHVVAHVDSVWALPASEGWTIDSCIPRDVDVRTVWITKGVGDYLNPHDFAWSRHFGQFDAGFQLACQGAAPSGTLVIDDATGDVLGVYPGDHDGLRPDGARPTTEPSSMPGGGL
jgi:hypothetical protein